MAAVRRFSIPLTVLSNEPPMKLELVRSIVCKLTVGKNSDVGLDRTCVYALSYSKTESERDNNDDINITTTAARCFLLKTKKKNSGCSRI